MDGRFLLARALVLMAVATACESSSGAGTIGFRCTVQGEAQLRPDMGAEAVCARIKSRLDQVLGTATRSDHPGPAGDWVDVTVRFAPAGIASAQMRRKRGQTVDTLPDLNIAVSDRPLGPDIVDQLAAQLADQLR